MYKKEYVNINIIYIFSFFLHPSFYNSFNLHLLHINYYILIITYYLLHINYYILLITYYDNISKRLHL